MHVGDTVESSGLTLTFVEVARDSRCPKNVQCIVAGEAHVVFDATSSGETTRITLEVPPGGKDEATLDGYTVAVEELGPEAVDGRTIEPSDYVATVTIAAS